MRDRFSGSLITVAVAAAALGVVSLSIGRTSAQAPGPKTTLKTPWGEPDLQGIWQDPTQTPLQRPAQYANREFLTDAEIAAIDAKREALDRREHRAERGTEQDVAGAYNAVFESHRKTGRRTSLVESEDAPLRCTLDRSKPEFFSAESLISGRSVARRESSW